MRYIYLGQTEKSSVAEQKLETGHSIDFSSISILDKVTGYSDCVLKEASKIRFNPRKFNREGSFTLCQFWYQVTNILRQYTNLPIKRQAHTKQAPDSVHQPPIGSCSELNMGSGQVWDGLDIQSHCRGQRWSLKHQLTFNDLT
jgi:hypothetical protein